MKDILSTEIISHGKYNESKSIKSKPQFSLNDILNTGSMLQTDLIPIIVNWRKYQSVIVQIFRKCIKQMAPLKIANRK